VIGAIEPEYAATEKFAHVSPHLLAHCQILPVLHDSNWWRNRVIGILKLFAGRTHPAIMFSNARLIIYF